MLNIKSNKQVLNVFCKQIKEEASYDVFR